MPTLETAVERQPIAEKGNANFTPTNSQMQVRVFRDQYAHARYGSGYLVKTAAVDPVISCRAV